jgi:ATP-binding cassette subfamily F protein uup
MDRLVDHLFVFEGEGAINDFPGNYSQYRLQLKDSDAATAAKATPKTASQKTEKEQDTVNSKVKKLSFKEKRELEILEKEIGQLEKEKNIVTEKLNSGQVPFDELQNLSNRIGEITSALDEKEMRWLQLSDLI